jgi:hypothetical protein
MVGALDADHLRSQPGNVFFDVARELQLRRSGPRNQNGVGPVEYLRDVGEEPVGIIGVLTRFPTTFRMSVNSVPRRQHRRLIARGRMNVKDVSFLVVDPDNGVRRHDAILGCVS